MKRKKLLCSVLFVALVAAFLLGFLAAAPVKAEDDKILFCGNEDYPPYSFHSDGQLSGYVVDLVRILSVTINMDIKLNLIPWNRCMEMVKEKKIDGLIGAPVYKEYSGYLLYSEPVAELEFAIFVEKGTRYINSLKSLEGTLVGVREGSVIIDHLKKYENITLVRVKTHKEGLKKLLDREITAFIAEKNVTLYYIQQDKIKDVNIVGPQIGPVFNYSLAVTKDKKELLNEIDRGIATLKANGTLQKLQRKWLGQRLVQAFPLKMVIFVTAGITGIMFALLVFLWVISLNATIKTKTEQIHLMSQRMVEKDKLAVLGKLAGQIAHELRTPLSIINNSVYLLRKEGSTNRELFEKRLRILEEKIKLSSNILESILSYSRVKAEVAGDILVKDCIEEVLKDLEMPKGVEKVVEVEKKEDLFVFMDFHQLYSVIRNLVLNSIQAMVDGGTLAIKAFSSDNGETVNIQVCDTGKGIAESVKNKVFNLFYSTKITGTGLGLPISKSIIEANQGKIILEETSEKGTCFIIKLPSSRSIKR